MRRPTAVSSFAKLSGRVMLPAIVVLTLAASGGVCSAEEAAYKTLAVGERAPLFKTTTIDGKPFDLQETLASKNTVLFFWSLFCSPCREEMPLIQKLSMELGDKPLAIVGVNLDEPALHNAVKSFLKSQGFTYQIVVNKTPTADAQTDKLYLVTGTPVTYLIKQDGTIAFGHVGRLEIEDLKKLIAEKFQL